MGDATAGEELVVRPMAEEMRGERRAADGGAEVEEDVGGAAYRELLPAQPQPDAHPLAAGPDRHRLALGYGAARLRDEVVRLDYAAEG